ncbi:hypothetical protein NKJ40_11460 [Mesorhizobium sp. M0119]|uniref:hypothetical protein n=1 Tax=unclassified Mesorhizobium TaxID=325217 RepID=UPI0033369B62
MTNTRFGSNLPDASRFEPGEVLHACTDIVCGEGQIEFNTPSGNIGCIYTPKGGTSTYEPQDGGPELSCSRVEPSYVTIILGPKGPATLIKNPGEQGCCGDVAKLAYGNSWSKGRFPASHPPRD